MIILFPHLLGWFFVDKSRIKQKPIKIIILPFCSLEVGIPLSARSVCELLKVINYVLSRFKHATNQDRPQFNDVFVTLLLLKSNVISFIAILPAHKTNCYAFLISDAEGKYQNNCCEYYRSTAEKQ